MAIVRKTDVIQVRCKPEDLAGFEEACRVQGIRPTERIRQFMLQEAEITKRRTLSNAKWRAAKALTLDAATSAPTAPEKPPVRPVCASMSLSERRKAEKVAKQAKMAKRAERF